MSTKTDEVKTFTSTKGVVIKLLPVSQFKIDSVFSGAKTVPIPVYEVEIVGGEKQEFQLNEEIARKKGRLDEWEKYIEEKKVVDAQNAKNLLEFMIWDGVDIEVPWPNSDWQKQQDYFSIKVPETEIARKLFYVHNELLGTQDDIGNLVADIFAVSRVDEETVTRVRDTFRIGIQQSANKKRSKKEGKVENKESNVG